MTDLLYKNETYDLIGIAMEVHNELGCGFLEAVYQEAFELELVSEHIMYEREKILPIYYKGEKLKKEYRADFLAYNKIIVELKALDKLTSVHESQLLNYLKATDSKVGLLINFGAERLEYKRMIFTK